MDDEGQPTIEERAGAVTDVVLRNARRRQAREFLAQQARHLDSADVRDEIRPLARAAGPDLLHAPTARPETSRSTTSSPWYTAPGPRRTNVSALVAAR